MGKRIRFISGAMVGALVQYLYDPERGRSRRARLSDQARARLRDMREEAGRKARFQQGRMKGMFYETKGTLSEKMGSTAQEDPSSASADDDLILQRIRSEVIGPAREEGNTIDLRVNDGVVVLKGSAGDTDGPLAERIRQVAGVREVINE